MSRKYSTDFSVGQSVRCTDPDAFYSPKREYLRDRVGTILEVTPVKAPDQFYAGHVNELYVKWGKRHGRGKEQIMYMRPEDLELAA